MIDSVAHDPLPVGTVGMSFREGPTSVRAALLEADQGPNAPTLALLESGVATGVVRVETCSRVTWVLSSPHPAWATSLLRAALLSAVGEAAQGREPRVRVGRAAIDHLLRVAVGLEAVVEGERAVGRQVLQAFERAHAAGHTDAALHVVWRSVGALLRRRGDSAPRQRGVHSLAEGRLRTFGARGEIPVLGTGEIGRAVERSVTRARPYARRDLADFLTAARQAEAVILCTGGPHPWVALPARQDRPLVVDLGSPAQLTLAPGWLVEGLDELLEGTVALPDADHTHLVGLVDAGCAEVADAISAPPPSDALRVLDEVRRAFVEDELPAIATGLAPDAADALRAGVNQLGHRLIQGAAHSLRRRSDGQRGTS